MTLYTQNSAVLRSLTQIYTRSNFNRIIRGSDHKLIDGRIKKHLIDINTDKYSVLLEKIYNQLLKSYRSEYFYKNALINKWVLGKYSLKTTTVLNEFKIGSSIADFVLLNGEARIYEIKTELDSLEKLEKQVFNYSQFGNKVYIVADYSHIRKLKKKYEDRPVGLIEYTSQDTLRTIKEAESYSANFDHTVIFKTLRKQEYLDIIQSYFGYVPNVPNTLLFKECLSLAKNINIEYFQNLAYKKLKERKLRCPNHLKDEKTPYELKHICYTMNLTEEEYDNLYNFLDKEFNHVSTVSTR